ncbi:MAG: PQQ-dependent sugar dehydrogenase, partial [Acidimicrobiaceae bacterium]|nr:PQQ-dependent sugar dehydrogenase [Acidimicrobiaceae bacterium]
GQGGASLAGGATSADPGQDGVAVRPDGNMFAADVTLQAVITLDEPIDMAVAPGDDLVWIAERAGRVSRVDLERGEVVETILDIGADTEASGERGLLGIAVTDRWLYANFTDRAGDTRVDAFGRDGTGLSGRRRTILFQSQPFSNHNGGDVAIGPDGFLYVAFGDGGSRGDPLDAGQDPTTWLGAVLRIEPTPDAAEPYAVPADNPLAADPDGAGRPEIFLTGVRNPWRFSFDRATGDLWIADVGQDAYEEVTVLLAANGGGLGANLGWRLREGLHRFRGDEPPDHADPVWEYSQDDGCSVTGGYVYRGSAIEDLYGAYVFGDYCTSRLWALQISTGEVEFRDLGAEVSGGALASFGEDADGELYALSLNGTVARIVPR